MKLTPKQKAFADNYIENGGNASAAARDAGYRERAAGSMGAENLKKPQIAVGLVNDCGINGRMWEL